MKNVNLQLVSKTGSLSRYLVRDSRGVILGLLEKIANTKYDRHPWKAFSGVGSNVTYLGAYYPEQGGKKAALSLVVSVGLTHAARLDFKVVAESSNANAFGLYGYVLVARDGRAWEVGKYRGCVPWHKGQTVFMPVDASGNPVFAGCEIPRELPRMPEAALAEVWSK